MRSKTKIIAMTAICTILIFVTGWALFQISDRICHQITISKQKEADHLKNLEGTIEQLQKSLSRERPHDSLSITAE